jgi:hypothetical protein
MNVNYFSISPPKFLAAFVGTGEANLAGAGAGNFTWK